MNVYFVDPKYIRPNGWEPLLQYLKVNVAISFIPKSKLAAELISIIEPYLKYSYSGESLRMFTNNCVYWLREYFEQNIRLISEDYPDVKRMPAEERRKYSSQSPHNNILGFDIRNCLILMDLESKVDGEGCIEVPTCVGDEVSPDGTPWFVNIPTQIASYCLNILHKKYQHNLYFVQSAFILFNKYFSCSYRYVHKARRGSSIREVREWNRCILTFKDNKKVDFITTIERGVHALSPDNFPIVDVDGKKSRTRLVTEEGFERYIRLLDYAKEIAEQYKEQLRSESEEDWQKEVDEMNRAFWRECGDAGSNCESWPGWG